MNSISRKERERDFHNKTFSEQSRQSLGKFYQITQKSRKFYRNYLKNHAPGKRVLEYGCGPGSFAFYLVELGAQVTGIDLSEVAIEQARAMAQEKAYAIDFQVMDAEALLFPDNHFDYICGTSILHHLDLASAFNQLARVLRPEGKAIFLEPLDHNPFIKAFRKMTPDLRSSDEHPLRMRDIALAKNYFSAVETHFFHLCSLCTIPLRNRRTFPKILRTADIVDEALFRTLPFMQRFAWTIIVILSKPRSHDD